MRTNFFTRYIAGPIAAAGILGGAAIGVAAAANADTGPSDHRDSGYSSDYRSGRDSHDSYRDYRPDFWNWFWHNGERYYGWHRHS